jgi:hypothetical protein
MKTIWPTYQTLKNNRKIREKYAYRYLERETLIYDTDSKEHESAENNFNRYLMPRNKGGFTVNEEIGFAFSEIDHQMVTHEY